MVKNIERLREFYRKLPEKIENIRKNIKYPLTLTEKILLLHTKEELKHLPIRGKDYVYLIPDRVAMQDATAQMALLQFMLSGKKEAVVPATVHCDHLIVAEKDADSDLLKAENDNKEVYDFLKSVSLKYNIDCWRPGSGIIHQIIFENYAFPGGLLIGTDSHTPNAGGLSMAGVGVGGSDAVDAMIGLEWELKWPKIIGVKLTGKLNNWVSPKDVILHLLGKLTVNGGTGAVIEYFGEGANYLSATGKATICNMGAELGATFSIFPFDDKMYNYLVATGRNEIADLAKANKKVLSADDEVYKNPEEYYDNVITIDLSTLEPYLNGPFSPDYAWPLSKISSLISEKNIPDKVSACLIGSCTNSSYEDIDKVASIAKQAMRHGLKLKCPLYISPGSERLKKTLERDGQLKILRDFGAVILSNSCGPCIGMWNRNDIKNNEVNTIVTTFNRNFQKRNDGNPNTYAFLASPETVMIKAISGSLSFDPTKDLIILEDEKIKISHPIAKEIPEYFEEQENDIVKEMPGFNGNVIIRPDSERLQELKPFEKWDGNNIIDAFVLVKIKGKCTTDHISMAGKWLNYRGHLDNISNNLLLGATNYFLNEQGKTKNLLTGNIDSIPNVARYYKVNNKPWVIIADENYGEGSSREHAAMEPRYLGCKAVIAKSFARIHETNLKKQGVLAFTFSNPEDYNLIKEDDLITIDIINLKPGTKVNMLVKHSDGKTNNILLNHTYNNIQIEWFKAGSALNFIKNN